MDYWRGMGTAWLLDVNFQLVPQMSRGQASGEGWRYVTLQSDRLLTNWTLLWILCQTDLWCPLISSWSTLMTWKVSSADETSCFLSLPVCIGAKVNLLLQANITVKFKVRVWTWLCTMTTGGLVAEDVYFRWSSCERCRLWYWCCMSCGKHPGPAPLPVQIIRLSHAFIILLRLLV